MEEDLYIRDGVVIPGSELRMSASRSRGPGGQHVNKTSTRVTLAWDVSGSVTIGEAERVLLTEKLAQRLSNEGVLTVHVEDTRSQAQNRSIARERLAALVSEALEVPKKRIPTRPTGKSKRRRVDEKRKRGDVKRLRSVPRDDD